MPIDGNKVNISYMNIISIVLMLCLIDVKNFGNY